MCLRHLFNPHPTGQTLWTTVSSARCRPALRPWPRGPVLPQMSRRQCVLLLSTGTRARDPARDAPRGVCTQKRHLPALPHGRCCVGVLASPPSAPPAAAGAAAALVGGSQILGQTCFFLFPPHFCQTPCTGGRSCETQRRWAGLPGSSQHFNLCIFLANSFSFHYFSLMKKHNLCP